jgi:hypothetical protein
VTWWKRYRERAEKRRQTRMLVLLTLSPSTLDQVKQRLADDEWAQRRNAR